MKILTKYDMIITIYFSGGIKKNPTLRFASNIGTYKFHIFNLTRYFKNTLLKNIFLRKCTIFILFSYLINF